MENLKIRRACVDATVIGMQMAEELQTKTEPGASSR